MFIHILNVMSEVFLNKYKGLELMLLLTIIASK